MSRIKKEDQALPNWERIRELANQAEIDYKDLCALIGKNDSWITQGYRRKSLASLEDIKRLSIYFRVAADELIVKPEPKPEPVQEKTKGTDANVMQKLLELEGKIDNIVKLLAALSVAEKKPEEEKVGIRSIAKMPRNERAKMLLRELIDEGYGKCLHTTYLKELLQINIASSYAEQAIKECGYNKGTTGIGANTVTWIIDPEWSEGKAV